VLANFVTKITDWQNAYFIGGGLGLMLLVARVSVFESGIYLKSKASNVKRGNVLLLFTSWRRFSKLLGCIFIGLPAWYAIGILITFSPEFAKVLNINGSIVAGDAVMFCYLGLASGDLTSGVLSQLFKTRKKVVAGFILFTSAAVLLYLFIPIKTVAFFYFVCFTLGFGIGYWAVFVTIAAEQFGTNLRSTVATSVPNFIRGTVIPLTLLFRFLREKIGELTGDETQGVIFGALSVGVVTVIIAFIALRAIDETFGRDLNFEETD
jgi:MFS family permease